MLEPIKKAIVIKVVICDGTPLNHNPGTLSTPTFLYLHAQDSAALGVQLWKYKGILPGFMAVLSKFP